MRFFRALSSSSLLLVSLSLRPVGVRAQDSLPPLTLHSTVWMYLRPADDAAFARAVRELSRAPYSNATRGTIHELEEILRAGPGHRQSPTTASIDRGRQVMFSVEVASVQIPVIVGLPPQYSPVRQYPLLFAMHGGPTSSAESAIQGAGRMLDVWKEHAGRAGWIVAAPAMVTSIAVGERTADRLPYEIFHPEQARAVVDAVRERYNVNPDRIVSTGISLGSNFSLAFAAGRPDWFSAIVPVSTEGESREHLLRNLAPVPVYVLEGARDRNIRGVEGPRALERILTNFGYDLTYREFAERAHEGFSEHYPDVLRWLELRPRNVYPREVLRVPNDGIVSLSKRVHWVEVDTRQALVHAVASAPNRIDVRTRWAGEITLHLHDAIVGLDDGMEVWVNGERAFAGTPTRSVLTALEQVSELGDERRIYPATVTVRVPDSPGALVKAESLTDEWTPARPAGTLSFWEMYAVRALEERFPTLGFSGEEASLPGSRPRRPEQIGIRVTGVSDNSAVARAGLREGDLLVEFGGEPFFQDRGGLDGLYHWLIRELRGEPRDYSMSLVRDGDDLELVVTLALGRYEDPARRPR